MAARLKAGVEYHSFQSGLQARGEETEETIVSMTVVEKLREHLRAAAIYNRHDLARPSVVIWPDGDRAWEPAMSTVQKFVPELLVLRSETNGSGGGPSTWLRYQLARHKSEQTPVLYLPGVSRAAFRGGF